MSRVGEVVIMKRLNKGMLLTVGEVVIMHPHNVAVLVNKVCMNN